MRGYRLLLVTAPLIGFAIGEAMESRPAVSGAGDPLAVQGSLTATVELPTVQTDKERAMPTLERFRKRLDSEDVLALATYFRETIQALTEADLHTLAEVSPPALPWGVIEDDTLNRAVAEAFVERWLEIDPTYGPDAIRAFGGRLRAAWAFRGESLVWALARIKPEYWLDGLATKPPQGLDATVKTAFQAMAQRDVQQARHYLEGLPESLHSVASSAIDQGIAETDPLLGVELALASHSDAVFHVALNEAERVGPGLLRQVLAAGKGKFTLDHRLLDLMLRYPEEDWSTYAAGEVPLPGMPMTALDAAARLDPEARSRLLNRADELPPELGKPLIGCLIYAWAANDPEAAVAWTLARMDPARIDEQDGQNLGAAIHPWLYTEEPAARRWWQSLPDSAGKRHLGNTMAAYLATLGRPEEALSHFSPGDASGEVVAAIATAKASNDPRNAVEWLMGLPPRTETGIAFDASLKVWVANDPAAVASWVESQPPTERLDEVRAAFARGAAKSDSAAATAWVDSIGDPQRRQDAAEDIYSVMRRHDPAGAAALLESLPAEDAEFVARLQRWLR